MCLWYVSGTMKTHRFVPGDLVRDKKSGEYGLVVRINDLEIIVGWQDVRCNGWDTFPTDVDFICHIPSAECLDKVNSEMWQESEKHAREQRKLLEKILKCLEDKEKRDSLPEIPLV